jgi:glycine cleavage system H protein
MTIDPQQTLYYKRGRFTSRLPKRYLYAPSHYWLDELQPGLYRVGATRFATRMLGDYVEHAFHVLAGEAVGVGQAIGWIEGFKALSDIYCVLQGEFVDGNGVLNQQPELLDADPYDRGWLYQVRGTPAENVVDVHGYASVLDAIVDRLLAEQQAQEDRKC